MWKTLISVLVFSWGVLGTTQNIDYSDVKFDKREMLQLVNDARMYLALRIVQIFLNESCKFNTLRDFTFRWS